MHIEFLVEEASAEAALMLIVPRILKDAASFHIRVFSGKRDLLANLSKLLRGYSRWIGDDYRIVVLVDEDRADCRELKHRLEQTALQAGLSTRSAVEPGLPFQVLNRIAVEELEAWFFGDTEALARAYPGVPADLGKKSQYRDPDKIAGGTWERLEQILQEAGYYPTGLPKIEAARKIATWMDPDRNTSGSFIAFRDALREMTQ